MKYNIFTAKDRTPFTYLIGWSKHDLWYYGSRYGKNAKPEDLWTTYFTSSKEVTKYRIKLGEPDVIQIRKIFTSVNNCKIWESNVLKKLNITENDRWLNKTYVTSINHTEHKSKNIKIKRGNIILIDNICFLSIQYAADYFNIDLNKAKEWVKENKSTDSHPYWHDITSYVHDYFRIKCNLRRKRSKNGVRKQQYNPYKYPFIG